MAAASRRSSRTRATTPTPCAKWSRTTTTRRRSTTRRTPSSIRSCSERRLAGRETAVECRLRRVFPARNTPANGRRILERLAVSRGRTRNRLRTHFNHGTGDPDGAQGRPRVLGRGAGALRPTRCRLLRARDRDSQPAAAGTRAGSPACLGGEPARINRRSPAQAPLAVVLDQPATQPEQADQRLAIADLAGFGETQGGVDGDLLDNEVLVRLGAFVAFNRSQLAGEVEVHRLGRKAGRGVEHAELQPFGGGLANFLAQLASGGPVRLLDVAVFEPVQRPGRDLEQHLADCVTVLPNQDDLVIRGKRHDGHTAAVSDDLPQMAPAVVAQDGVVS